ncbi:ArsR family transcriptional regulator [Micromonospora pisi]|uniref:ArsR family transcriptional regulator n=1 Tax=Micromonospora pisi TaxID=589240 RepID=A0A495JFY8_9ACTN|nr:winged helix-turn-helix domain-containing protein [Micromonospora pisi]RKR87827.1 ArsR family transcriptional regulator [Micromonospora pisi]
MGNRHPHEQSAGLAALAGLLADRTRATICLALLDGRAWTATELARHAQVAASTATGHLNLLVDGGLLTQERQGRHRYVRLAGPGTAELIELLTANLPHRPEPVSSLSMARQRGALAQGRTCYDHLAGKLGVGIADAMTARGHLDWARGLTLTEPGTAWLRGLGVALPPSGSGRRPVVRSCLDWTERRPHLAGAVGAALCRYAFDAGWITRIGTSRAVALTGLGRDALREQLDLPDEVVERQPDASTRGG